MATSEMKQHIIKISALGRRFQLGDLYDYRKDRILPDTRLHQLWASFASVDEEFKLRVIRPESNNKWEHMGLDAHSQASVLIGLIDKYRGAINYLNDTENPMQVTKTLICRTRSKKQGLDFNNFPSQDFSNLLNGERNPGWSEATHVVVGITYGAEAYCVMPIDLDYRKDEEEAREEAVENLSKVMSKMRNALYDTQNPTDFKNQFDEEDRKALGRLEFRLYIDCQVQSSREGDVFDTYRHCFTLVEQMMNKSSNKAVPIKVHLLPLKVIMATAGEIGYSFSDYYDVETDLVRRCSLLWAALEEKKAKAKALAKTDRSTNRKANNSSLLEFAKAIQQYQQLFIRRLERGVEKARAIGGNEEVETTVTIAENHLHFQLAQLDQWLDWKQSEIRMVGKMINVAGITLVANKNELENRLVESRKYALVLGIQSMDVQTNKVLKKMKGYLDTYKTLVAVDDIEEFNNDVPWHTEHGEQIRTMSKVRELVDHVSRNTILVEKNQAHFFIALNVDDGFFVYQSGNLVKGSLADLPASPTGLRVEADKETSVFRVKWDYKDLGYPYHFLVQFRVQGSADENWQQRKTAKPGETEMAISLISNRSAIEFRVAADTCIGLSEFSDIEGVESVTPQEKVEEKIETRTREPNAETVEPLEKPEKVAEMSKGQQGTDVLIENLSLTGEAVRFAEVIVDRCQKIGKRNGIDLFAVPLIKQTTGNKEETIERYSFGSVDCENGRNFQHKTILVMGATGAGKTTLINAMINYIFDVRWEDPFRFQLIQEQLAARSKEESQTSCVTTYDIHHCKGFRVPYSLTIVDTPGYGDTKGVERDKEITEMIRLFFEDKRGIQELDVIGFVAQASSARLTPTQVYIIDSVLSIFGKDVGENISFMLTFADSQVPPVLNAIAEADLPCSKDSQTGQIIHHKFNNSGFFCSNHGSGGNSVEKFNKFFWEMGMKNFEKFFNVLTTMKTKSLSLTKEVLGERKLLEATVNGLQPLIKVDLAKLEEMRKTKESIENFQEQIKANNDFAFKIDVMEPKKVMIRNGGFVTNCSKCFVTCHNPCGISKGETKFKCSIMDKRKSKRDRTCTVCPNKCLWNLHFNQEYTWEYENVEKEITLNAMKEKYEAASEKKLTAEELVVVLQKELDDNRGVVLGRIETVVKCIRRLDEIALRPNPFSTPQYIDLIIDAEQNERRDGFQERIKSLRKLRQMSEITNNICNKHPLISRDRY